MQKILLLAFALVVARLSVANGQIWVNDLRRLRELQVSATGQW
jgi:hypothetical protein